MKKTITSIWFLALIITIPITFLIPKVFDKYNCELIQEGESGLALKSNPRLHFVDLDSDGKMERIESFKDLGNNRFSIQIYDNNGGMFDQINFPERYNSQTDRLFFEDVDNDGHKEVYKFSYHNDSLYLTWLNLTPSIGKINSLPLCKIHTYGDNLIDYQLYIKMHCLDVDNDGSKELIFPVNAGFSILPRQIFLVNPKTKEIRRSENSGSSSNDLQFYDLNNDNKLEIITNGSVGPIRSDLNLLYNKPAPYLSVFNSDLEYYFEPIKFFEGIQSSLMTQVVENSGKKEIIAAFMSASSECVPFRAYKIDLHGHLIDSLLCNNCERTGKFFIKNEKGNFITQIKPSVLMEFNSDLKIVKTYKLGLSTDLSLMDNFDYNDDGTNEVLFLSNNKLYLFSDNFRWYKTFSFDSKLHNASQGIRYGKNKFFITTLTGEYYIYQFSKNPYYWLRFLFYLALFFVTFSLITLFTKIIESRIRKRYDLQNKIRELQIRTFKNQLEPHFILNTFNNIASVIKQGRNEEAYHIFMKFSNLFRTSLQNTEKILIPLREELKMINNYIEIQNFRFKDVFNYVVDISENVDLDIEIPKMLLQVHIENAIKHGLISKRSKGNLELKIRHRKNIITIEITDDGIGRKESKRTGTQGTGLGIKTINDFIALHNQNNIHKISYKFIDLYKDGKSSGTKVEIIVPV
ncbi:sensor histidine kinase [Saccharicrinis sp. FJH2]|uniref:sensor histidine kinase n=1 Tax=Saccharicrinis sp. FJH65 TaxID=3344659 RepID=UPI0035F350D7